MNFNNFTIKSQEAIQKAVEITRGAGTQAIEPVCLLKGVIDEGESLLKFIFQKIGANTAVVIRQVDTEISALPKVSGQEPYLSRTSNDVLQKALDVSKSLGDQYVTIEALLLALFEINSPASTILKDAGLTKKEMEAAIEELRKGKKATDQSAEESYNALSKYAINLNERARSGKLDPVIGRDDTPRASDIEPPHKKQPHAYRRTRYRQDCYRRGSGTAHYTWRRARKSTHEADFFARHGCVSGRCEVQGRI